MDKSLEVGFDNAPKYSQKDIKGHFGDLLTLSEQDLDRQNVDFLKVVTTWVVRSFADRRKGGVPTGLLNTFAYPENHKIDFTRTLMVHIIKILRKRGLKEWDLQRKSATFDQLVRAFDVTAQKTRR